MDQNDEWIHELKRHRELSQRARQQWEAHNYKVKILVTKLHNVGGLSYYKIAQATGYSERWVRSLSLTEAGADVERIRKGSPKPERIENRGKEVG